MGRVLDQARKAEERNKQSEQGGIATLEASDEPLSNEAAALVSQRQTLFDEAERIILLRLDDIPNRWPGAILQHFTAEEVMVFDALGWSNDQIAKEAGRLRAVREHQAAADLLAQATKARDENVPKLEEQIAELQRQVRELEGPVVAAQAKVNRQTQAVLRLRGLVPLSIQQRKQRITGKSIGTRTELAGVRKSIESIKTLASLDTGNLDHKRQAALYAETQCPEAVGTVQDVLVVAVWNQFVKSKVDELPALEARREELEKLVAEADESAAAATDYYTR